MSHFAWDLQCFECLQMAQYTIVVSKPTDHLGNTNQKGLRPKLEKLKTEQGLIGYLDDSSFFHTYRSKFSFCLWVSIRLDVLSSTYCRKRLPSRGFSPKAPVSIIDISTHMKYMSYLQCNQLQLPLQLCFCQALFSLPHSIGHWY